MWHMAGDEEVVEEMVTAHPFLVPCTDFVLTGPWGFDKGRLAGSSPAASPAYALGSS